MRPIASLDPEFFRAYVVSMADGTFTFIAEERHIDEVDGEMEDFGWGEMARRGGRYATAEAAEIEAIATYEWLRPDSVS